MRSGRRLLRAAAAVALVTTCTCARGRSDETVVRFWQFWDLQLIMPLVERFEAAHPGVRVEVEQLTWKSGLEKIQASLASGTQPDLCELGSTWLPRFSYEGVLEDLSEVHAAAADSFLMWESAVWKGRVYGLPWVQGSRALFYNRDLFRRAGLDPDRPPETWEALLEASRRIHELAPDIYGFGQNLGERYVLYKKFMAFAWGNGGRILDDGGAVAVDGPETLEALEFYRALAPHALQEKQEVLDHYFKTGKLGMQISGAWNLRNYRLEAPRLDYGVALVPRPSPERGTHASFAGAEMLVVFRGTKHRAAALALARYLQGYAQAKELSLGAESVFPAHVGALSDSAFTTDARVRVFVQQALTSRTPPAHPGWVEMEDILNRAIEETLYGRRAPRWCLESAAAEIRSILEKYERRS
jgi:multiple sugar transport system substrate-binding protein